MSSEQMLTETACQLKEFLASKNVMGEPTDFEEKVVIPIARFGFGFGSGGVQAKDGSGVGAGGGGGIDPVAVIILHKDVKGPDGVQVMSLRKESAIAQVISSLSETLVPQVIDAIKSMNQNRTQGTSGKQEEL
jgi:uncharacterized spore protein YtfJ